MKYRKMALLHSKESLNKRKTKHYPDYAAEEIIQVKNVFTQHTKKNKNKKKRT